MTLVILGIISIINIRQISCLSLFHMIILHCGQNFLISIVTTQVGVPDSKIALHVNVHFYTDKVTDMMPLL